MRVEVSASKPPPSWSRSVEMCDRTSTFPPPTRSRLVMHRRLTTRLASLEAACGLRKDDASQPSFFHSTSAPDLSLLRLAEHLVAGTAAFGITYDTIALAIVLMERFDRTVRRASALMMHRLFVSCVWIAIKLHCDVVPPARLVASTAGVGTWELARMEGELVECLQYRLFVNSDELCTANGTVKKKRTH